MPFDLAKRRLPICLVLIYIVKEPEGRAVPNVQKPSMRRNANMLQIQQRVKHKINFFCWIRIFSVSQGAIPLSLANLPIVFAWFLQRV